MFGGRDGYTPPDWRRVIYLESNAPHPAHLKSPFGYQITWDTLLPLDCWKHQFLVHQLNISARHCSQNQRNTCHSVRLLGILPSPLIVGNTSFLSINSTYDGSYLLSVLGIASKCDQCDKVYVMGASRS